MADLPAPVSVIAAFADRGVKLPLRLSDDDIGVVLDDDGADVFTVDSNGFRADEQVQMIAAMVVLAVNDLAGVVLDQERPQ